MTLALLWNLLESLGARLKLIQQEIMLEGNGVIVLKDVQVFHVICFNKIIFNYISKLCILIIFPCMSNDNIDSHLLFVSDQYLIF